MRLSFYLDKPQAKSSAVMLNVAMFGQRLRFGTGISIDPKHWNGERQEPRATDPHRNANRKRLIAITGIVNEAYNAMSFASGKRLVDEEEITAFKARVLEYLSPQKARTPRSDTLLSAFDEFIQTYTLRSRSGLVTVTRPSDRTLGMYRNVLSSIKEWADVRRKSITYEDINLDFYTDYCTWLSETKSITDSTTSNHIKILKTFMKWAMQKGYHDNRTFEQFFRDRRVGDTVSLTADELRRVRDLDLAGTPRLARTRDHFLLQCFTGMRYGDLLRLQPHHFDDEVGIIRFTTQKTDTKCVIPITTPMRKILDLYPSRLFEFASDVKQNLYLKDLAKLAGFNQQFTVTRYKGGRRVDEVKARHELITTHVARRSFATLSIRFGIPEAVIAAVTGHSAKGMLQQHYIRLAEEDIRDIVVKGWDQF